MGTPSLWSSVPMAPSRMRSSPLASRCLRFPISFPTVLRSGVVGAGVPPTAVSPRRLQAGEAVQRQALDVDGARSLRHQLTDHLPDGGTESESVSRRRRNHEAGG